MKENPLVFGGDLQKSRRQNAGERIQKTTNYPLISTISFLRNPTECDGGAPVGVWMGFAEK